MDTEELYANLRQEVLQILVFRPLIRVSDIPLSSWNPELKDVRQKVLDGLESEGIVAKVRLKRSSKATTLYFLRHLTGPLLVHWHEAGAMTPRETKEELLKYRAFLKGLKDDVKREINRKLIDASGIEMEIVAQRAFLESASEVVKSIDVGELARDLAERDS